MYVHPRIDTRSTLVLLVLEYPYEYGCTAVRGEIGNRVVGAYQRYDGVPITLIEEYSCSCSCVYTDVHCVYGYILAVWLVQQFGRVRPYSEIMCVYMYVHMHIDTRGTLWYYWY